MPLVELTRSVTDSLSNGATPRHLKLSWAMSLVPLMVTPAYAEKEAASWASPFPAPSGRFTETVLWVERKPPQFCLSSFRKRRAPDT